MASMLRCVALKLGLLAVLCPPIYVFSDDLASVIDLTGISGPYSFERFCRLRSGEWWAVGGDGHIIHYSSTGERNEQQVSDSPLSGVYFINSDCGWVVGTAGAILHTSDAGKNWVAQNSGTKQTLEGITCLDENHCWAVGRNGVVLQTENAGRDWKHIDTGLSEDFYAVDFINALSGWVAGEDGIVVRTLDAGITWQASRAGIVLFPKSEFAIHTDLLAVKFFDANLGWVGGPGGIARTTDGGDSWQTKLKRTSLSVIGLVCHDGKRVWAINKSGKNYSSEDAGGSWKPYPAEPARRPPKS